MRGRVGGLYNLGMSTFGHVIFGTALGRVYCGADLTPRRLLGASLAGGALALLPDLDLTWHAAVTSPILGHRGITHSLSLACCAGLAIGWLAGFARLPRGRTALFACCAIASHGLLDTLTDCGTGCALLWPLSDQRFLAPFRPVPPVPVNSSLFTRWGLQRARRELMVYVPILIYLSMSMGFALRAHLSAALVRRK